MRLFPKIHDLYVGRVVLGTVLLTWAVLLGLDVMLGFVTEFSDVGKGNYGCCQAVTVMALYHAAPRLHVVPAPPR